MQLIAEKVAVASRAQQEFAAGAVEDRSLMRKRQAAVDTDRVDVDYIGQPQELLQSLAHRYGYQYVEVGKRADLRTINVRLQQATAVDVMRSIGHQIDASADVVLDKSEAVIRLMYKPSSDRTRG